MQDAQVAVKISEKLNIASTFSKSKRFIHCVSLSPLTLNYSFLQARFTCLTEFNMYTCMTHELILFKFQVFSQTNNVNFHG